MTAITATRLHMFAPHAHADIVAGLIVGDAPLLAGNINTARRLQHFMGQCYVESGGFTTLTENLNYSAERLIAVWPTRFRNNPQLAHYLAYNPEAIANNIYGGRMGNIHPSDGWRYRGGGILQMTGRGNYTRIAQLTGLDLINNPDMVRDPTTCLAVASLMWNALRCNEPADNNESSTVTRRINGGTNAASERARETLLASHIFTEAPGSARISAAMPIKLINDDIGVVDGNARAPRVPLTARQAKTLQGRLKLKNFSPGEVDGNIHSPSTVGAIATLQKQNNLPVTGEVDDATEDAIQNTDDKVIGEDRLATTADTLRAKGSKIIAATDSTENTTHGVTATGVGLFGGGLVTISSAVKDQILSIRESTDGLGVTDKVVNFISDHSGPLFILIFGIIILGLSYRLYKKNNEIRNERVRKARTGEDMSH